ncbi:cysteine desulfurase NifS [Candidatus Kaiserbacteria bacterium CG10_big_fil_rev_8_21_14_0_10_51_14]|uniref:Cysteine desulfurase NifS n=1 Tax=Candidatus Kaiserbacteria bacterium CG10_big_fil_rev_8_21_14_0_10_51_14 TaxID=1974610 RepID=A0A2H0UB91_9BACT|nr:MAG: cysteine desulfurase NifS [Candidatus Kaiserbacteria bacterium CG10_big_fil_rev_8_21_14_0_10_51_14]
MFWSERKRIYLDYASATLIVPEALRAMNETEKTFGNPGSIHAEGVAAKKVLEGTREGIAHELGCKARQIIFTSGLTESNNLAILGFARKRQIIGASLQDTHWVTTSIEHDSVLGCFAEIERMGGTVSHVEPTPGGLVTEEKIANALRPNTVFVSVGWGNNEIGTVQSLSRIARVIRNYEKQTKIPIVFHSDAGQAPLYLSPQVHTLSVDMLALGAGKLYGPRSIGALYIRDLELIAPFMLGGGQEKGLRAGTEKVVPAVGFAKALEIISKERGSERERLRKLRDTFAHEIIERIPTAVINGDLEDSLPHMLNISISGERTGEYLVLALDHAGVAISTKSACREGEARSHVVAALGGDSWRSENSLRFSLGRETRESDLSRVTKTLSDLIRA